MADPRLVEQIFLARTRSHCFFSGGDCSSVSVVSFSWVAKSVRYGAREPEQKKESRLKIRHDFVCVKLCVLSPNPLPIMACDIWCYSSLGARCFYSDSVQWKSVLVWFLLVITTLLPAVQSHNQGELLFFSFDKYSQSHTLLSKL